MNQDPSSLLKPAVVQSFFQKQEMLIHEASVGYIDILKYRFWFCMYVANQGLVRMLFKDQLTVISAYKSITRQSSAKMNEKSYPKERPFCASDQTVTLSVEYLEA